MSDNRAEVDKAIDSIIAELDRIDGATATTDDGKTEEEDRAAKGCIVALLIAAAALGLSNNQDSLPLGLLGLSILAIVAVLAIGGA